MIHRQTIRQNWSRRQIRLLIALKAAGPLFQHAPAAPPRHQRHALASLRQPENLARHPGATAHIKQRLALLRGSQGPNNRRQDDFAVKIVPLVAVTLFIPGSLFIPGRATLSARLGLAATLPPLSNLRFEIPMTAD